MRVEIRLFAGLRQRAGTDRLTVELKDGARVSDALAQLRWLTADTRVLLAVNREYAPEDRVLAADDELALIPPVSGGATAAGAAVHVRITGEALRPEDLTARVSDPRAGAVVTFLGVTREVPALQYEAYAEMAQRELEAIVTAAAARHELCSAAAEHRTGKVGLSEPSVVVAASAPHREQAFAGAHEIIDQIKARAPIWKREQGRWLEEHVPPGPG
ncbi:MAG: molybdenum cofactor biosynthesis protein [Solirubrobacteraceae bacterium]